MAGHDPFTHQLNQIGSAFKRDILKDCPEEYYPDRIDWIAEVLAEQSQYAIAPGPNSLPLSHDNFDKAVHRPYLKGIKARTGNIHYLNALSSTFPLGDVVLEYAALVRGLERVVDDVDPGEILGRLIVRELQRQEGTEGQLAQSLHPETRTPRELIEQLCATPELADEVEQVLSTTARDGSLVEQLGAVHLATQLWDHQRAGLRNWLEHGGNGYVNMATATGKTVLGLAAVGYCIDSGSLHPVDEAWLEAELGGTLPDVSTSRNDVLIVTTDDLLGTQWARLFQQHCHTPPEYTRIVENSIRLPWGTIDIRSARSLSGVDPRDYRLAIFDEVHNYSRKGGWGENLLRFVDSPCPVLALTGSETEALSQLVEQANRSFDQVFEYTHEKALNDGVIPDFEWSLDFIPVDRDAGTLEKLQRTATIFENVVDYEPTHLRVRDHALDELDGEAAEELRQWYPTPTRLAKGIRDAGTGGQGPTETLDLVANGLANRQTHWWNLRADQPAVVDLVADAMEQERPTLILTRSYAETQTLYSLLRPEESVEQLVALDQNDDATSQERRIDNFDSHEAAQKVLIGPGRRLGTGIDITSIACGINLARPGTGMNASLVQRLGRLLRKSDDDRPVEFHHVMAVPHRKALIPVDGASFVRNVCEFYAQVEAPSTDGILKIPSVSVTPAVSSAIRFLEQTGGEALRTGGQLSRVEQAYCDAIADREATDDLALESKWFDPSLSNDEQAQTTQTLTTVGGKGNDWDGVTLVLRVETADRERVADAFVALDGHRAGAFGTTDDDGQLHIPSLPAGTYEVSIHHPTQPVKTLELSLQGKEIDYITRLPETSR